MSLVVTGLSRGGVFHWGQLMSEGGEQVAHVDGASVASKHARVESASENQRQFGWDRRYLASCSAAPGVVLEHEPAAHV